jgi:hypothetical protein
LAKQEQLYKESLKDLNKLKLSLSLYRKAVYILGGVTLALGGYIVGDRVLNWW